MSFKWLSHWIASKNDVCHCRKTHSSTTKIVYSEMIFSSFLLDYFAIEFDSATFSLFFRCSDCEIAMIATALAESCRVAPSKCDHKRKDEIKKIKFELKKKDEREKSKLKHWFDPHFCFAYIWQPFCLYLLYFVKRLSAESPHYEFVASVCAYKSAQIRNWNVVGNHRPAKSGRRREIKKLLNSTRALYKWQSVIFDCSGWTREVEREKNATANHQLHNEFSFIVWIERQCLIVLFILNRCWFQWFNFSSLTSLLASCRSLWPDCWAFKFQLFQLCVLRLCVVQSLLLWLADFDHVILCTLK